MSQANVPTRPPRRVVITCDVLSDEIAHFATGVEGLLHVEVLRQGLHNDPPKLRTELQAAVDRVEDTFPEAEAIALGYGLCSRGVEGVVARRCTLVLPRAHDCITLLLGDRHRYADYVARNPGTYWYSPGWNRCHVPPGQERHDKLLEQYRAKFGDEDAAFLMETEQTWFKTYDRATWVNLLPCDNTPQRSYTQDCAQWLGWQFDEQVGDPGLLVDLLRGAWDEERFLVLTPGETPKMTADADIVVRLKVRGKESEARDGK